MNRLLLGELYKIMDGKKAKLNFQKAFSLAKTTTDRQTIQKQIDNLYQLANKIYRTMLYPFVHVPQGSVSRKTIWRESLVIM